MESRTSNISLQAVALLCLLLAVAFLFVLPQTASGVSGTLYLRTAPFTGALPPSYDCTQNNIAVLDSPGGSEVTDLAPNVWCWYSGPYKGAFPGGEFTFHVWIRYTSPGTGITSPMQMTVFDSVSAGTGSQVTCPDNEFTSLFYIEAVCTISATPYSPPSGSYFISFTPSGDSNFRVAVDSPTPGEGFSFTTGSFGSLLQSNIACNLNSAIPGGLTLLLILIGVGILLAVVAGFLPRLRGGSSDFVAHNFQPGGFAILIVGLVVVFSVIAVVARNFAC